MYSIGSVVGLSVQCDIARCFNRPTQLMKTGLVVGLSIPLDNPAKMCFTYMD